MGIKFKFFTFILLSFTCITLSQNIKGQVIDSLNNPIPLANIQLLEKNTLKSVFFSQTDNEGKFLIECKNIELPIILKITHLSFERKEFTIENCNNLTIILTSKTTVLKEVTIKSKSFDVVEKNDTLKYNLKTLLNGSETKLKDVLEKLPGISLDENGKIRFNGKKINNLLLDGEEFFKNNHQLATENITSEMIEGIEFLKNYQNLSSVKDFENKGATALNIKLNEKFKNQFKGNIDAEGGILKRYKVHNNLYNFGKKNKLNLIANTNNLNATVISVTDYVALKKESGKKFIAESETASELIMEEDLPSFLFSEDNVKSKTLKNYTFNYSKKINAKKRIEFVSILNKVNQVENTLSTQLFFDQNTSSIIKKQNIEGSSLFFYNNFKFENKKNEASYFTSNIYALANKDSQSDFLTNTIVKNNLVSLYNNNVTTANFKAGYNGHLKKKISSKILIEGLFFNDFNFNSNSKEIASNLDLIQFDLANKYLNQNTKLNTFSFGVKGKSTFKLKKGKLTSSFTSLFDNEKINNVSTAAGIYDFSNSFFRTNNFLKIKYSSSVFKDNGNYSLGINYANSKQNIANKESTTISAILPSITFNYHINKTLQSVISFNQNFESSNVFNFLSGNIINDYRSELLNNPTLKAKKSITNSYQLNLSYIQPKSNIFSVLNLIYNNINRSLDKTYSNNVILSAEKFDFLNLNKSVFLFFIFEKKSNIIPYGINIQSLNSKTIKSTLINSITTKNKAFQNKISLGIKSYYKQNDFNFDLGIEYLNSISKNIDLKLENKLEKTAPFINFNGLILDDKINWNLTTNYYIYKTTISRQNNIFDLGFKINYNLKKSSFFISGNNVLNIRNNNLKNSINYNQVFVEEIQLNSLSGYVNVGYSFLF